MRNDDHGYGPVRRARRLVREVGDGRLCLTPGYGDERLQRDTSGRFPVRSRVGARNLTLSTFLGAFLARETLRLSSVEELDTGLRPWRPDAADGRVVPWNLAVTAVRHGS